MSHSILSTLMLALVGTILLLSGCAAPAPKQVEQPIIAYPAPPDPPRFFFERSIFGTGDVKATTEKERLKTFLTGAATRRGEPIQKPFDVAVHKGRVFISDSVARIVHVLDFVEQRSFRLGDEGGLGDLTKPLGLATDAQGTLYVVDATAKTVKVYNRDGQHQRDIGDRSTFSRPSGIDVTPDGKKVYVVDTGGVDKDEEHRILVFDGVSGSLIQTIGTRGTAEGELNLARDIAVAPNGDLYVTDGGNFRVQVFSADGRFIRAWGRPGRHHGEFSRPKGIAIDAEGNVYAVDAAFGNFQIFDPNGALLMFIGQRSTQGGPGLYMLPAGIDVDEDGRVYLVEQFFHKVDVFRPAALPEAAGFLGRPAEDAAEKQK